MAVYCLDSIYVAESAISYKGVFTSNPIKAGTVIFQYKDILRYNKLLTFDEVKNLTSEQKDIFLKYFYQIDENLFAGPISYQEFPDISIFWNHSCSPNTYFSDIYTICAMRDIQTGEELVYDYATTDSYDLSPINIYSYLDDCKCKSSNCRSKILYTDWKLPELQKKYDGFFIPYLAEKIKNDTR